VAHERRRAALAALCVFAIALAATLLPASGFGSQPAGVGVGGDPDAPASGEVGSDPESTSTSDSRETTSATTATTAESSGGSETTTEQPLTTTETTTEAAGSDGGGDGSRDLLAAIAMAALGLAGLLGLVGFRTGALAVSTGAAGPLPVTIVVRGTPIDELAGSIPTRTMALVVGFSASIPRLLDDAATLTGEVGRSLGSVLGGLARGSAEALRIGAQGFGATLASIPRALAGLGAGAGLLSSIGRASVPSLGRSGSDATENRPRGPRSGSSDPEETGPSSIEEAWTTLRDRVPVRNRDARTPGEVARAAARRGYPDEAVRRLTDAFREVRYGDLPREDRTDSARSALDRLRNHWRGEK
jgi:hypothetical protein